MSSVFDYGGKPVNKNTAMAISGGVNYDPDIQLRRTHFDICPTFPNPPDNPEIKKRIKEMIGIRKGRMITVCWWSSGKTNGSVWLCRCDCGDYETRKTRAIKNPENKDDCCQKCRHLKHLKRSEYWRRTGKEMQD